MWKITDQTKWNKSGAEVSRNIIRLACLFCENLSIEIFNLEVYESDYYLDDFQLICLKNYYLHKNKISEEIYGFTDGKIFYPIDTNYDYLDVLAFCIDCRNGIPSAPEVRQIKTSMDIYRTSPDVRVCFSRRVCACLPADTWHYVENKDQFGTLLLAELRKMEKLKGRDIQMWITRVPFCVEYHLVMLIYENEQVDELSNDGTSILYTKTFLFAKPTEDDGTAIRFLTGISADIFNIWDEGMFHIKNESEARAYLKFFCWAIEGDLGNFCIPNDLTIMPWAGSPDEDAKSRLSVLEFGIKELTQEEEPAFDFTYDESYKLKAVVAYGNSIFQAIFQVDKNKGLVEMVYDIPLIEKLPLQSERFGTERLSIFN